jgi:hypothetical protein
VDEDLEDELAGGAAIAFAPAGKVATGGDATPAIGYLTRAEFERWMITSRNLSRVA